MSADRFQRAAKVTSSGSWNKCSCALGDPINWRDPRGRDVCPPDTDNSIEVCDQDPGPGGDGPGICDVNPTTHPVAEVVTAALPERLSILTRLMDSQAH